MKDTDEDGPKMTENERIIRAFAGQFDPPLPVCGAKKFVSPSGVVNIDGDGWQTAFCTKDQSYGVTCVIYGPQKMYAFLEANGDTDVADATDLAREWAKTLGRGKRRD